VFKKRVAQSAMIQVVGTDRTTSGEMSEGVRATPA
jgi:hypothetical protein